MYRLYPRYRYRLKYSFDTDFLSIRIQEIQCTDCIQDTDTDWNTVQIQIFFHQIVSGIQEIQYTDCIQDTDTHWNTVLILICIQDTDTDWNTVLIQIYLSNCIQNTRNPVYRLYPRYRYRLKYSFDTDFLSIRIQEIQYTDCIQDTDTDWNTVLIQIYLSNCI